MSNIKKCSNCNELKSKTEFSKSAKTKDGLQYRCKICNKAFNDVNNYRVEVTEQRNAFTRKYLLGDKDGVIYTITNPTGDTYVGSTKLLPNVRWYRHKYAFENYNGKIPGLHKSFEKWGIDAHEFKVIENHGDIPTTELRQIESNMIKAYKLNGKSLNINN